MTSSDDTTAVPVGEFTFDVRTGGPADGTPVVLLHGFPQTSWAWRHQIASLGDEGYRVVAPDLRGYSPGARPRGVGNYRLPALAGDVLGLIDALDLGRIHLVGHDWGGAIAWHMAADNADVLRSVTAISTPHPSAMRDAILHPSSGQAVRSSYVAMFQIPGLERLMLARGGKALKEPMVRMGMDPADADHYVAELGTREALGAALNYYRALRTGGVGGGEPIKVPTLYVWSTGDAALGRTAAERTADHVEGPYRFEVLEGVSHWVPEEAASDTTRLLLEHFRAHPD